MVTDSVGDFLTRIRNANLRREDKLSMPSSKILASIAGILKKEGFIEDFEEEGKSENKLKNLIIKLKYESDLPRIRGLKRVSKPGVRIYVGYRDIPKVLSGYGISILTTSQGIMTGDRAKKEHVGGELLCQIW